MLSAEFIEKIHSDKHDKDKNTNKTQINAKLIKGIDEEAPFVNELSSLINDKSSLINELSSFTKGASSSIPLPESKKIFK